MVWGHEVAGSNPVGPTLELSRPSSIMVTGCFSFGDRLHRGMASAGGSPNSSTLATATLGWRAARNCHRLARRSNSTSLTFSPSVPDTEKIEFDDGRAGHFFRLFEGLLV